VKLDGLSPQINTKARPTTIDAPSPQVDTEPSPTILDGLSPQVNIEPSPTTIDALSPQVNAEPSPTTIDPPSPHRFTSTIALSVASSPSQPSGPSYHEMVTGIELAHKSGKLFQEMYNEEKRAKQDLLQENKELRMQLAVVEETSFYPTMGLLGIDFEGLGYLIGYKQMPSECGPIFITCTKATHDHHLVACAIFAANIAEVSTPEAARSLIARLDSTMYDLDYHSTLIHQKYPPLRRSTIILGVRLPRRAWQTTISNKGSSAPSQQPIYDYLLVGFSGKQRTLAWLSFPEYVAYLRITYTNFINNEPQSSKPSSKLERQTSQLEHVITDLLSQQDQARRDDNDPLSSHMSNIDIGDGMVVQSGGQARKDAMMILRILEITVGSMGRIRIH